MLSESSLIFFPGSVEAHSSIDPLLEHDPVVNMDRRELTDEWNRRVDGLIAGDIIWNCFSTLCVVLFDSIEQTDFIDCNQYNNRLLNHT